MIGDPDPKLDDCAGGTQVTMSGKNIGDLLNAAHVSWGFFEGGFRPSSVDASRQGALRHVARQRRRRRLEGLHPAPPAVHVLRVDDEPAPPAAELAGQDRPQRPGQPPVRPVGLRHGAGHNNLPSVSFLKPAAFEDAHPGNSDPLDEQRFIARALNALEESPAWSSTAVVIVYDDSDGWYDHADVADRQPVGGHDATR